MKNRSLLIVAVPVLVFVFCSCFFAKPAALESSNQAGASHVPIWKQRLVIWPKNDKGKEPWQNDSRLKGHFHKKFPNDLPVVFVNLNMNQLIESMWVRVIDFDRKSDLFLGIILNQPHHMSDPSEGDMVVFRFDPAIQRSVAVAENNSYRLSAGPLTSEPKFLNTILEGITAYRQGRFGHNMPKIEKCIEILSPAVETIPPRTSNEQRFAVHFTLARCFAEKYETKKAIEQFKRAIAADPDDFDAQMGLLAELQLMVLKAFTKQLHGDQPPWDKAFLDQLSTVKSKFGNREDLKNIFSRTLKELFSSDPSRLTAKDIALVSFRWKMK